MLARQPERMTVDEFLEWEQRQDEKHELVDGRPVLRAIRKGWIGPRAMAGGTTIHNLISGNIFSALKSRLRGSPCRPYGSDMAVETSSGYSRYPDVVVDCGPLVKSLLAAEPTVIFEVLSPSNSQSRLLELLDDYRSITTTTQVVFVEQIQPAIVEWNRHEAGWRRGRLEGMEATLALPSLGLQLPLQEIYEDVPFT